MVSVLIADGPVPSVHYALFQQRSPLTVKIKKRSPKGIAWSATKF